MPRASACQNYSPKSPCDARVAMEAVIPPRIVAKTERMKKGRPHPEHTEGASRQPSAPVGNRTADRPRAPPPGDPTGERPLDQAPRSPLHCAVPHTQLCSRELPGSELT
ncbi:hypothetical protein GCM10010279_09170 [Streptomyces mutabilis]|nr:hypothetical protein GCM10010279_09170 [Streptomyces mutabilis]